MRNVVYKHTERGFSRVDFDDLYGERCSLQKSSLAEDDAIWLGQNEAHVVDGASLCRMHLTKADVTWLLPMLEHFARTGELPLPPANVTRIYLMAARKAWHHDVPKSWKEVAWERFDYIECAVFEKPTADLTYEDRRDWVTHHSEPPEGWVEPTSRSAPSPSPHQE